jgi:DNA-binding SARP family transcriptional activator
VDFVEGLIIQRCASAIGREPTAVRLFGGPFATEGDRRLEVPEGSKRLLAFAALHEGRVDRRHAAGMLWPAGDETRAAGNLRSALWRLNGADFGLLWADNHGFGIRDDVLVDVRLVADWATRVTAGVPTEHDLNVRPWGTDALELLPGWYDDWALMERERMRQRLLHAIEVLSTQLSRLGRGADAVEAALLAVAVDPLRESAQRALISAHLAEGNWVEARRVYAAYYRLLDEELRTQPDPALASMIGAHVTPAAVRARFTKFNLAPARPRGRRLLTGDASGPL